MNRVLVIGGGHAGCEAALACARMGVPTVMITGSADTIGVMPCNPAIGGPAKSQIVSEVDALGGEMGRAADATFMQMKLLNRSRGAAVQCVRSQNDKYAYQRYMQTTIERTPGIEIVTGMVVDIEHNPHENTAILADGTRIRGTAIVVTTGTFLSACMHTGEAKTDGGRVGEAAALGLSDTFRRLGLRLGRFKTGTPPRLHRDSIDTATLPPQPGDPEFHRFSLSTPFNTRYTQQADCFLSNTTPDGHALLLANLDRSPLYNHSIQGVGPRYCPSIEDKVVRFSDKPSHHIFLEPESWDTPEIYAQGLNTSMPADIQLAFLKTMPGLANVSVLRYGYAVEYDYVIPTQLTPTLASQTMPNLFFAGQLNGTSGYEEAAGQGLIAGINAGLYVQGKPPLILTREQSFIGTLIDDLITKTIDEPYRMLTSRSEYRLLLRQDNAHFRLSALGRDAGVVSESTHQQVQHWDACVQHLHQDWKKQRLPESAAHQLGLDPTLSLHDACKRPEFDIDAVFGELKHQPDTYDQYDQCKRAHVAIKYAGYLRRQQLEIDRIQKWEQKPLPSTLDYTKIPGLRAESRQRLIDHRPQTIRAAKRIGGINPADLSVLITYLS